MDVSRTGLRATGDDGCALALLGLKMELRLKNLPGHLPHLLEDGQRGGGNAVEVWALQNVLDKTFAPSQE
jgi:hypothetical protein